MEKFFCVLSEEYEPSFPDEESDEVEIFCSCDGAIARANELARQLPGEKFFVCQTVAVVRCPVGKPGVTMID